MRWQIQINSGSFEKHISFYMGKVMQNKQNKLVVAQYMSEDDYEI